MKLEAQLEKLEKLASQIETEDSLEKSLAIFEESVVLAEDCLKQLDESKGKLTILSDKVKEITNGQD